MRATHIYIISGKLTSDTIFSVYINNTSSHNCNFLQCTRCLQEISFKTDPKNTDYEIEAGATRNFMALKLAEEQALREEEEAKEEEANNPMKLLENRTKQSKNEIELLESLEELKDLNRRQRSVDFDSMLMAYDTKMTEQEREKKLQDLDEEYIKSVKFESSLKRKVVVEEEIVEEVNEEPVAKAGKISQTSTCNAGVSLGARAPSEKGIKSRKTLSGIVKINSERVPSKSETSVRLQTGDRCETPNSGNKHEDSASKRTFTGVVKINKEHFTAVSEPSVPLRVESGVNNSNVGASGLSLLGAYSDSDNSEGD